MLGREDKIGFSVHSRKLHDLSNEAAMLDPRCAVYNGLFGLLEDGSNLLDVAIALVSRHPSIKKYRPEIGA
ncbi:hypothetical protein L195_g053879 [Trifolium pratense]|uniref:Uncharacterized protein n=1 Tax=Trifolium pratense TaxID=57577 RepID=A0A2K3KD45_TRIPR|nr:hypothetical protein L195_g053879 [Trifolium pratense]